MPMQMTGQTGPRHRAQVEADVESLGLESPFERGGQPDERGLTGEEFIGVRSARSAL